MFQKKRGLLAWLIVLMLCMSVAVGVQAEDAASYADAVSTISLESTPAWGRIDEFETHRIVLTPGTGQVLIETEHDGSGEIRARETYVVEPARIGALIDTSLPGLLMLPDPDAGMALDGYYIYITVNFNAGYTIRVGGHVADMLGPQGFRDACDAIRELAEECGA